MPATAATAVSAFDMKVLRHHFIRAFKIII